MTVSSRHKPPPLTPDRLACPTMSPSKPATKATLIAAITSILISLGLITANAVPVAADHTQEADRPISDLQNRNYPYPFGVLSVQDCESGTEEYPWGDFVRTEPRLWFTPDWPADRAAPSEHYTVDYLVSVTATVIQPDGTERTRLFKRSGGFWQHQNAAPHTRQGKEITQWNEWLIPNGQVSLDWTVTGDISGTVLEAHCTFFVTGSPVTITIDLRDPTTAAQFTITDDGTITTTAAWPDGHPCNDPDNTDPRCTGSSQPPTTNPNPNPTTGPTGVVGCSNHRDAVRAYNTAGGTDLAVTAGRSLGGGILSEWVGNDRNTDRLWAEYAATAPPAGHTAAWAGICIGNHQHDGTGEPTQTHLDNAHALIARLESTLPPDAPIYISGVNLYAPGHTCTLTGPLGDIVAERIADQLADLEPDDNIHRGPVLGPLDASTTRDGCHTNADGATIVAEQLVDFFNDPTMGG